MCVAKGKRQKDRKNKRETMVCAWQNRQKDPLEHGALIYGIERG
jgi:hypothetical protein